MNLLELFSGTRSVRTIAKLLGYNIILLDLKNADINCDILEWDYKQFDRNHFDFIWSNPPCTEYSKTKTTGIKNIEYVNSIVLKTIEIITYFNPTYFVIENPQIGLLKSQEFMNEFDFKDVNYCNYGFSYGTENALDFGITLRIGHLEIYIIEIVEKIRNNKHIETAQRLPSKTKAEWGDNYLIHKQEDLYKIPAELICEILTSLVD